MFDVKRTRTGFFRGTVTRTVTIKKDSQMKLAGLLKKSKNNKNVEISIMVKVHIFH